MADVKPLSHLTARRVNSYAACGQVHANNLFAIAQTHGILSMDMKSSQLIGQIEGKPEIPSIGVREKSIRSISPTIVWK